MQRLSRRDFLKLSAAGAGGLAFSPFNPPGTVFEDGDLVRVAIRSVSVYSEPSDKSQIVATWFRDDLVHVYEAVTAPEPKFNPVWYRVWGGYMHRAHLQTVKIRYNEPATSVRPDGQLGEVTVPYTDAYRLLGKYGDQLAYRIYYQSVHWVKGVDEGPDGEPWYRLFDELLEVEYNVPAIHMRLIADEEWAPISPDLPFEAKRVEVELATQTLTAFENDMPVFVADVSTGLFFGPNEKNGIPTKTPRGLFHVEVKMPSKHMGDGNLAGGDLEAYELVGVPWDVFFTEQGHAFHGAYWHDNFGNPMSHGCVNMRPEDALWLFRWTRPAAGAADIDPATQDRKGYGTMVRIY